MSETATSERIPQQPLHPSIIPRVDPEYVELHQTQIQYWPSGENWQMDPVEVRRTAAFTIGASQPLEVGKVEEFEYGGHGLKVRVWTPKGDPETRGWPVLLYLHGGGWMIGGLNSDENYITNFCARARCVVISVDYRLAPEDKFPAAVDDVVEALQWVITDGKTLLNLDLTRLAISGLSAGGNLAAVLVLKAVEESFTPPLPAPMVLQLLMMPIIDLTSTDAPGGRYEANKHAPLLTPSAMKRAMEAYLQSDDDRTNWVASPIFAPAELMRKAPKTWIAAGEVDVLCNEDVAYAEKLRECGVEATCVVYERGTHMHLGLDGTL